MDLIVRRLRSAGLEPATPWFEARYSIQLSYGRDILRLAGMGRRVRAAIIVCHMRRSSSVRPPSKYVD